MASGSARVAILAMRNRRSSHADPPEVPFSGVDPTQTETTSLPSSKHEEWPRSTSTYDTECLLDGFSLERHSDSDSSDSDSDEECGAPAKRTVTSSSLEEPDEFVKFVESRVKRESQLRKDAHMSGDSLRKSWDTNPGNEVDDMRCYFPTLDEASEGDSVASLNVCRSPRLDDIPAASEYLSSTALQAALKMLYKKKELPAPEQQ
eukprot:TRINITY_DN27005_c0_g1_i1.p1 TRINITY_DN27005_c0_g1~~TRINITY_DN27005_c0_g1_i1.p1  ORF type:complete len:205 (+),score=41.47 TRINITY_DN27005_c0_g1_i1:81-695(+)